MDACTDSPQTECLWHRSNGGGGMIIFHCVFLYDFRVNKINSVVYSSIAVTSNT